MLNGFAKLLLTCTAIAPVGLVYAWVAFLEGKVAWAAALVGVSACLLLLWKWLLFYAARNLEQTNFKISSIEAADRENTAFLVLYLAPLFTGPFSSLNWHMIVPALVVFGLVVATGYSYHFNPLLGILGWHFYRVTTPEGVTYVLITRKQLRSAAESLTVVQLTEYVIIDAPGG